MSENRKNAFERNDDFWDIEDMLPKRRVGAVFSKDTDAEEISVGSSQAEKRGQAIPKMSDEVSERLRIARETLSKAEEKHHRYTATAFGDRTTHYPPSFDQDRPSDEPLFSYSPKWNPLVKEVTVKLWPARYSFYEQFRLDAEHYYEKEGKEAPHVPFFSFTPQFSQLSPEQLAFYLYFRRRIREGDPIKADYSYVLLLIFEIINLPHLLPPEKGVALLCLIWKSYRSLYPKLDRHLSEWVCDYCLIHRLDLRDLSGLPVSEAIRGCALKEFYVGGDLDSGSPFATALFSYASGYDYRSSKFITEENRSLFDTHIKGAFIYAFTKAEREHQTVFAPIGQSSMIPLKTVRDAYNGALCAYNVKRRIEVSFLSCSRSAELRYAVTDTIKFAENQIRAMLGIRSRFHTPNLAIPLRSAVEEYFAPYKKEVKKEAERQTVNEYDALYEPVRAELSLDYALDIEGRSWATTELLTEGLEGYCDETAQTEAENQAAEKANAPSASQNEKTPEAENGAYAESDGWVRDALALCIDGNKDGFVALSHSLGMLPDALCEAVNDRLYDHVGDIVIENLDGEYTAVVDYLEEIKEWMKK